LYKSRRKTFKNLEKPKLKKSGLVRKEPDNIALDRLCQAPATMYWQPSTDKMASILAHCCLQTWSDSAPCSLRLAPCSLLLTPCALRPAPCALRPAPCAFRSIPMHPATESDIITMRGRPSELDEFLYSAILRLRPHLFLNLGRLQFKRSRRQNNSRPKDEGRFKNVKQPKTNVDQRKANLYQSRRKTFKNLKNQNLRKEAW